MVLLIRMCGWGYVCFCAVSVGVYYVLPWAAAQASGFYAFANDASGSIGWCDKPNACGAFDGVCSGVVVCSATSFRVWLDAIELLLRRGDQQLVELLCGWRCGVVCGFDTY